MNMIQSELNTVPLILKNNLIQSDIIINQVSWQSPATVKMQPFQPLIS